MTDKQRIHFFALWRQASAQLAKAGLDKAEIEEERQNMLKLAGAGADKNGRYSASTLDNNGVSTCLDFMETTILGRPNKRRRSKSLVWAIEQLGLDDAYLDRIALDQFKVSSWRDLNERQLAKFRFTATSRARSRK